MTKKHFIQGFSVTFIINFLISYLYINRNMSFANDYGEIGLLLVYSVVMLFSIVISVIVGVFYSKYAKE